MRRFRLGGLPLFVSAAAAACMLGAAVRAEPSRPALTRTQPCPQAPGFTCSTLTVPLDHRGKVAGHLNLQVATQNGAAPRGVLVFLTGGPGQPGVPFVSRITSRLGAAIAGYRLVMFDQRGTGAAALHCPALQRQMGSTDLAVPTRSAVVGCARAIGSKRRFFSTADTVQDLDALRAALRADKLALDGVSYGTFVAERYALRYPTHVARLVLDSVVPHVSGPPFRVALSVSNAHAVGRVLRAVCRREGCRTDPARDLAIAVRRRAIGPAVLNALVTMSVADPTYPGVVSALHAARGGTWGPLVSLLSRWGVDSETPAEALSQGLHASALCADTRMPWGGPSVPPARRLRPLRRAVARISPKAIWPFTRAVASGNGIVKTCLYWPATPAAPQPSAAKLPRVPTLLLAGDHDLSTPLAWAQDEARRAPQGRLVVVHGSGHGAQLRATSAAGRIALEAFLHGR